VKVREMGFHVPTSLTRCVVAWMGVVYVETPQTDRDEGGAKVATSVEGGSVLLPSAWLVQFMTSSRIYDRTVCCAIEDK